MTGSNTFGGTIKLEGEKAYREAVKQINSNLRVLASEMGKVTAEFTKNDKSTTALTSRNKILNEQIEKQKEKISVLKNALAQSSEKYGENDKKTNNWKVSLNKAEAELSRMESSLKDVNVQMEKSKTPLDKLNTELSEQGTKLKELQTEYKNIVLGQGRNSSEAKSLASEIKNLNNDIRENKEKLNAANSTVDTLTTRSNRGTSRNLIDSFNSAIENTNRNVADKLDSILYFLQDYIPELKDRQMYLDTGVLVGELTPSIDRKLAKIENNRERGR